MSANNLILKEVRLKLKKQTFNLFMFFISNSIVKILPYKITSNINFYLPKCRL